METTPSAEYVSPPAVLRPVDYIERLSFRSSRWTEHGSGDQRLEEVAMDIEVFQDSLLEQCLEIESRLVPVDVWMPVQSQNSCRRTFRPPRLPAPAENNPLFRSFLPARPILAELEVLETMPVANACRVVPPGFSTRALRFAAAIDRLCLKRPRRIHCVATRPARALAERRRDDVRGCGPPT